LWRKYRALALSGLLSGNLDATGHSKMCHPIQDRALERQFIELIVNLASFQPIAEVKRPRFSRFGAAIDDWPIVEKGEIDA